MEPLVIFRLKSVNLRIENTLIFHNIAFRHKWIFLVGLGSCPWFCPLFLICVFSFLPFARKLLPINRVITHNTVDMWTISSLAIFFTVVMKFLGHLSKIFFPFQVWNAPFCVFMAKITKFHIALLNKDNN